MLRKQRRRLVNREDEDPMAGSTNIVDAMLVLSVGFLLFLVVSGNMENAVLNNATPEVPIESLQNAPEVRMGEENITDVSPGGFVEMGRVYRDPQTGKLVMVEE